MPLVKKKIMVTAEVEVTVDDSKLNEEFMKVFRETFYDFASLDEHMQHLARLEATGTYDMTNPRTFAEGYGEIGGMGIKARVLEITSEVEDADGVSYVEVVHG